MVPLPRERRLIPILAVAVLAGAFAVFAPRIPQDLRYHDFADQRTWQGIPNFENVASNVPYVLAGIYGLWTWWSSAKWRHTADRWPWFAVTLGTLLIGLGSGYYHWRPNNTTLFWDRVPMTFVFMGLLAAAITERVHREWGFRLLVPFVLLGALSVEVWRQSELAGAGDLRFYAVVQFFPAIAFPLILWLFPSPYTHGRLLWHLALLYVAAKLAEAWDRSIFDWTGHLLSGHTLKHLLSAAALFEVMRMLYIRKPITAGDD